MDYIIIAMLGVTIILLLVSIVLKTKKQNNLQSGNNEDISRMMLSLKDKLSGDINNISQNNLVLINELAKNIGNSITNGNVINQNNIEKLALGVENKLEAIRRELFNHLKEIREDNQQNNKYIKESTQEQLRTMNFDIIKSIREFKEDSLNQLEIYKQAVERNLSSMREELERNIKVLDSNINVNLKEIRQDNNKHLEDINREVNEKLTSTLNTKINESFKYISEQLESVYKGLGEVKNLTTGVNNLNKVLSNVKTRGVWGEVSLDNILEQIFTTSQYEKQFRLSNENIVDFAIVLPGKNSDKIYLPIDAKFPLDRYEKLVQESELADRPALEKAKKEFIDEIKRLARDISNKYIQVPKTTDFAIMYFPTEGMYAEVAKECGLLSELQNKHRIIVCGPTTVTALLNCLQIGFKTLSIQKSSSEVFKMLEVFRAQFIQFSGLLDKSKNDAEKLVKDITETSKRGEIIQKKLDKVSSLKAPDEDIDDGGIKLITDLGEDGF